MHLLFRSNQRRNIIVPLFGKLKDDYSAIWVVFLSVYSSRIKFRWFFRQWFFCFVFSYLLKNAESAEKMRSDRQGFVAILTKFVCNIVTLRDIAIHKHFRLSFQSIRIFQGNLFARSKSALALWQNTFRFSTVLLRFRFGNRIYNT